MKKREMLVILMMTFWILLPLAGCGSGKEVPDSEQTEDTSADTEDADADAEAPVQEETMIGSLVVPNQAVTDAVAANAQAERDAQADEETISGKREASQHLLEVWSGYLQMYEKANASALWALDYADAYIGSADWNDLMKARAACVTGTDAVLQIPMPEDDLTEEEYFVLSGAGVDTSELKTEFEAASNYQAGIYDMLQNRLFLALVSDVFQQSDVAIIKRELAVDRDIVMYTSQYYCLKTNYLLLTLGDEELASEYWKNMKTKYPTLCKEYSEWIDEEDVLLEKSQQVYESYQKLVSNFSEIESLHQKSGNASNDDLEKLYAGAHTMANVPALLPVPSWIDFQTADIKSFLLETDETGAVSINFPKSGDTLPGGTYGMQIEVKDRNADEINAYIDSIGGYAKSAWKDEAADSWYIVMPDYEVRIDLENQTATILIMGRDVTFVPEWYIQYSREHH